MKVAILVKGRFHTFQLAYQLQQTGCLSKLITSFPKFISRRYGLQDNLVDSLFFNEILERAYKKIPYFMRKHWDSSYFFSELFDCRARNHIPQEIDLLVAWTSFSLHSIQRAKKNGIKIILVRGNSHTLFQQEIMNEEYNRLGIYGGTHLKIVKKELEEYELVDYIGIPSTFVRDTFLQNGFSKDKLILTHYGVDLSYFKPRVKKDTVFRIIFSGACCVRKGAHYLLEAFLKLNLEKTELWFVGRVYPEMHGILKKYSLSNVVFKGSIPEFELSQYYSQGTLFCLPSLDDGFGMVVLQAMACGLPVICSTNTGASDVVRDGVDGYIIPIRNVEAIQEKILRLYQNPLLRDEMANSALKRAQEFTWKRYGEQMLRHYRSILKV